MRAMMPGPSSRCLSSCCDSKCKKTSLCLAAVACGLLRIQLIIPALLISAATFKRSELSHRSVVALACQILVLWVSAVHPRQAAVGAAGAAIPAHSLHARPCAHVHACHRSLPATRLGAR